MSKKGRDVMLRSVHSRATKGLGDEPGLRRAMYGAHYEGATVAEVAGAAQMDEADVLVIIDAEYAKRA